MSNNKYRNLDILDVCKDTIKKYNLINLNESIVVAVSGGPDSIALLDILTKLKEYNLTLIVAHVNHMLRKESEQEAVYVEEMCKKYNVIFEYKKVDVEKIAQETKKSTETVGREERYKFFDEILTKYDADKIAVAHNLDDSVETTFMNMFRGSGINGLIGIKYSNEKIIRPLLNVQKSEILNYCKEYSLNPCFDKTNEETIYTRNKIRLELVPYIKENFNPNINHTILRLKEILMDEQEIIDEVVEKSYNELVQESDEYVQIDRKKILNYKDIIVKKVIKKCIEKVTNTNQNIEAIHIDEILELIKVKPKGKKFILGKKYIVENVDKYSSRMSKM